MYKQVRMFIGWLNYVMNHQSQGSIGTAVILLQHLQPTNQLLDSFWSWAQAKGKVDHYTSYVRECSCYLLSIIFSGYLVSGGPKYCTCLLAFKDTGWFRCIMCVHKMSYSAVATPFGSEIKFCSSDLTICKRMILPYDPGGLALQPDEIGGTHGSNLIIIGLRASRISRGGECNTPNMGCHIMCVTWALATRWAGHWRLGRTHKLHMQPASTGGGHRRNESFSKSLVPWLQFLTSCSLYSSLCLLILTPDSPCIPQFIPEYWY